VRQENRPNNQLAEMSPVIRLCLLRENDPDRRLRPS
jgi:hypothetical protein